jgi:hypothetical protein
MLMVGCKFVKTAMSDLLTVLIKVSYLLVNMSQIFQSFFVRIGTPPLYTNRSYSVKILNDEIFAEDKFS